MQSKLFQVYLLDAPSSRFTLTGFIQYRTYTIRIRAETSAGYGQWSASVEVFTGKHKQR